MPDTIKHKEQTEESDIDQPELINIEWQAPEFEKYEKGAGWFIALGIIALIFFTVVLLMKNFIFAILIVLIVFTIFIYALKQPRVINFKISGKGITIEDKLFAYQELKSFWIFYEIPDIKELSIRSKKWLMPLIKIPLEEQDPSSIRRALIKFIPEQKQELSLVDIIARNLKF
jgi:hypothetical protein